MEGGHTNEESAIFAAEAVKAGVDAINVTGGWHETLVPQLNTGVPLGTFVYLAGGIKEKVLAARRSGISMIVLPEANRKNLEQIPRGLRRDLKFVFVKHVLDVFSIALADAPTPPEKPAQETLVSKPLELEVPTLV